MDYKYNELLDKYNDMVHKTIDLNDKMLYYQSKYVKLLDIIDSHIFKFPDKNTQMIIDSILMEAKQLNETIK